MTIAEKSFHYAQVAKQGTRRWGQGLADSKPAGAVIDEEHPLPEARERDGGRCAGGTSSNYNRREITAHFCSG
jgi:hypothetical protein